MRYTLLIVDDEPVNLLVLSKMLKISGEDYHILTASTGKEACSVVMEKNVDLVLLDWGLPVMQGSEVLHFIKKNPKTKDIPVIIQTAYSSSDVLKQALHMGAIDFLRKPIDQVELLARVNSALMLYDSIKEIKDHREKIQSQVEELINLSLIVQKTANSVMVFDSNGELEWANEGFEQLYGYTQDEFIQLFGLTIRSISHNTAIDDVLTRVVEEKKARNYITYWNTKNGEQKWIQTNLTPIFNVHNELEKIIAIESDITRLKNTEKQLMDKNEVLEQTKNNLEELNILYEKNNQEIQSEKLLLEKTKSKLEYQKQRIETILYRILPYETVIQLKSKGSAKPRNYKMATVLFADIKGFTKLCEMLSPQEIVDTLDFHFAKFDEIIDRHNLEKIKTIGDAYMCAGGLPLRNHSNPIDIVLAGLEIQDLMTNLNRARRANNELVWDIRVGIHTGALVAGVVGKNKIAYDVWGDTVNIAARMESSCEVGKVNVSGETYELISPYFDCTYRGKVEAKNKGKIDMYYVNALLPKYASEDRVFIPNDEFMRFLNGL